MGIAMKFNIAYINRCFVALLLALSGFLPGAATAAATELADGPLATGLGMAVKPNLAFIFDDSGSMDEQNMPDGHNTHKDDRCWGWHKYNTLFYNPAYTYKPPFKIDGAVYSDGVTRFPDAGFSAALKDGYFPSGGYTYAGGSTSNTTTNLATLGNLTPDAVACNTTGGAGGSGATATLTIGGSGSTSVSNVKVGSTSIFSGGATSSSTKRNTVAARIAAQITANGYSAVAKDNVVTIQAPYSAGNLSSLITVTQSGGMTIAASGFSGYVAGDGTGPECASSPSKYYYATHKTEPNSSTCEANDNYYIVTNPDKIEAPGIPNTGRTAEQIAAAKTNYANWYTYYRSRAQLMKAGAGEAFRNLEDDKYRIGLFFLNSVESGSNGSTSHKNNDFKIDNFRGSASGTQRYDWYTRLYGARSDVYTPLRGALSRMGRMYAGQIAGWDPVQYSCQQNFTILSTDGFWNTQYESGAYGPKKIDGTTNVGNQDGGAVAAIPARATITSDGDLGGRCYRASSITVNTGAATPVELLNEPTHPAGACTKVADDLGQLVVAKISAGTSGFTAVYSANNNRLTITAPVALGNLTVNPVPTFQKVSGSGNETFTVSAFSGGAAAVGGAALPFADTLNVSDTLADIAHYYYTTDLRDLTQHNNCSNTIGSTSYTNLCDNNVRGSGKDNNTAQHMSTFTLGLGVNGTIKYESNYETAKDIADETQYYDIVNGTARWPNPTTNDDAKIDDLWHAAVNGRGTYYSASNARTLQEGLEAALAGVQSVTGASAAAATSSQQPVAGDNFVYVALYRTVKWDGDLKAFTINTSTNAVSTSEVWSAQAQLDDQVAAAGASDGRTIKFFSSSSTAVDKLKEFTVDNLTADNLQGHFEGICGKTPTIAQCGTDTDDLAAAQKTLADDSINLVNYLRGHGQHEDEANNPTAADRVYRGREHVLGDIINAVPVYVKKPPFSYDTFDTSYGIFKSDHAERAPTVYIAANDGMLHAINGENGTERWAYIPTSVMPNMWRLADKNYSGNHRYFVDGSPAVVDICANLSVTNAQLCATAGDWKTIVVGGLNKGGCGYYALDVTNPASPKGLWEFTHPNLGYSFGKPVVAKNKSGRWVVFLTSGYNNASGNGCGGSGDGNGHLFVLDAATGALLEDIPTYISGTVAAGSSGTPSGLAKINAWVANAALPIADRVYGGDMLGNVWRFDFDANHLPSSGTGKEAVLIAQLKDGGSPAKPQPITVRPELAQIEVDGARYAMLMLGTGRYLGDSDISDQSQQSLYVLKDSLGEGGIADVRGASMTRIALTHTTGPAGGEFDGKVIRTSDGGGGTINWATADGWYLDFNPGGSSPGERVNVSMSLQNTRLVVATNVPDQNACNIGGYAFLYSIDFMTGTSKKGVVGALLGGNALVAGISEYGDKTIVTNTAGGISIEDPDTDDPSGLGATRRTTWREIPD
jgi:type IV pilus assembly protein PilY1